MLVRAFFDESGDLELGDVFTIGGLAGPTGHWADFAARWGDALSRRGVDDFHMSEFENRVGVFEGWLENMRRDLLAELVGLLVQYPIVAFGASLDLQQWRDLPDRVRRHWVDPYLVVFQAVVQKLAQMSMSVGADHKIDFTFDRKDRFRAKAEDAFARLQKDDKLPGREKMGELRFGGRRSNPELQAADLFVYELRKYDLNERNGRPRKTRWPMGELAEKQRRGQLVRAQITFDLTGSTPA